MATIRRKPSFQSTDRASDEFAHQRRVGWVAAQRLRALLEDRFLADKRADVGTPLLDADGLFAAPVDCRRRNRRLLKQFRDHRDDVVFVDRVVDRRAARWNLDRDAAEHHLHVEERPSPVVAVRNVESRDDRGHTERTRHGAYNDLACDLGDGIRWEHRLVVVTESGALGPRFVVGRVVHRRRRTVQESLRVGAVRHQKACRFGVRAEVLVPSAALGHRKVEDIVEVGRKSAEIARREVHGLAPDAALLQALARRGIGETGDAPHLVVGRQRLGDGCGHLAARSGDENLGSAHALIVRNETPAKRAG